MKRSVILTSLLVLSVQSFATDIRDNWFVGFQAGNSENKVHTKIANSKITNKNVDKYGAFKIGKYFEYGRVYMGYNAYDVQSNIDMHYIGMGYDYLFYNSTKFTPYLGLNGGYEISKASGAKNLGYDKDELDLSGFTYGLEAGVVYELSKNVDIEIFASYFKLNSDDTLVFNNTTKVNYDAKYITHVGIGFNYSF